VVLGVTDLAVNDGQDGLLQNIGHATWVTSLTPSCDVAGGSYRGVILGQTDGGDVFVELDGLLQFEHGDVVVESAGVPSGMDDDPFHFIFSGGRFLLALVVCSNADRELSRIVDILVHAVSSSDDGLGGDDGTTAHGSTVL